MTESSGLMFLNSGRWIWRIEASTERETMELVEPGNPANKMYVTLPFSWRQLPAEELRELARAPEVRLWTDGAGILWRVAAVGPGTSYEYPLGRRHLVFDSQQSWAGLVDFPAPAELGDLTSEELRALRDHISDFGGRRRRYRAPGELFGG